MAICSQTILTFSPDQCGGPKIYSGPPYVSHIHFGGANEVKIPSALPQILGRLDDESGILRNCV